MSVNESHFKGMFAAINIMVTMVLCCKIVSEEGAKAPYLSQAWALDSKEETEKWETEESAAVYPFPL